MMRARLRNLACLLGLHRYTILAYGIAECHRSDRCRGRIYNTNLARRVGGSNR